MADSHLDTVRHALGGEDTKPAKKISHIETSKAKSGGYTHTHHHTHPEHHPSEHHVSSDDKAMADHMIASMGSGAAPSGDPTDPAATEGSPAADAGAAVTGAAPAMAGSGTPTPGAGAAAMAA